MGRGRPVGGTRGFVRARRGPLDAFVSRREGAEARGRVPGGIDEAPFVASVWADPHIGKLIRVEAIPASGERCTSAPTSRLRRASRSLRSAARRAGPTQSRLFRSFHAFFAIRKR